jgi:hypothetical protein
MVSNIQFASHVDGHLSVDNRRAYLAWESVCLVASLTPGARRSASSAHYYRILSLLSPRHPTAGLLTEGIGASLPTTCWHTDRYGIFLTEATAMGPQHRAVTLTQMKTRLKLRFMVSLLGCLTTKLPPLAGMFSFSTARGYASSLLGFANSRVEPWNRCP